MVVSFLARIARIFGEGEGVLITDERGLLVEWMLSGGFCMSVLFC